MIRLQFAATGGPISNAIAFVTRGWCSHVDTILPDGRLLGARFSGGVAIRAPDYITFSRKALVELACADAVATAYYEFINSQVGKPYDVTADAGILLNRDWRENDSWMCSELVAAGLEHSGFLQFQLCTPTNQIPPASLLLVLSALTHVDA